MTELGVSERRTCRVLGQHRSTQRKARTMGDEEAALTAAVVELACRHGRYGYRRITALLQADGWRVNHKRVERIWRREGLKVPAKQPKRGRLWLNDGSCIRLRPERPNHVWSYDFVADRTYDGRAFRMLCIIDEFTRESLAIDPSLLGQNHTSGRTTSMGAGQSCSPRSPSSSSVSKVRRAFSRLQATRCAARKKRRRTRAAPNRCSSPTCRMKSARR